jgi:hypothetical protein
LAAVAVAALVLVACGSSGTTTSQTPTSTTTAGVDPNTSEVSPAGDIPDNQVYVDYSPPAGGYTVKIPEGWARTDSGGAITFTDKLNSIRLEASTTSTAPTVASVKQDEVPAITAASTHFEGGDVKAVDRKAGTAILMTYRADSAADPVTGKVVLDDVERYELWANGTKVTLTLSGPKGADNVDPWRIVTDSFTWK